MSERHYEFAEVDCTNGGYWDADFVVGCDYSADVGVDGNENEDVDEQVKQIDSKEENDVDVGKDEADYTNLDENADGDENENVNERMDRDEIEGANCCEMRGDEVVTLIHIQG